MEDTGLDERQAKDLAESMMQLVSMLQIPEPLPLANFLLSEEHRYIQQLRMFNEDKVRQDKDKVRVPEKADAAWRAECLSLCRKHGIDYQSLDLEHGMKDHRGVAHLPPRERKGLALWMRVDNSMTTLDVQPSMSRMCRGHEHILPTITPQGKTVLMDRGRILSGLEALSIQGYPPQLLLKYVEDMKSKKDESKPDGLLHDLAGNAFTGVVMLTLIIAVITLSTKKHLKLHGANPAEDHSSGDSDVIEAIISGACAGCAGASR